MTAPTVASAAASYAALDAAYRAATAQTAIAVAQGLLYRWTSVSGDDLAGTSRDWLDDSIGLVLAGQRNAVEFANRYTLAIRRIAVPDAPLFTPPPPRPPNEEQIRRSLEYVAFKQTGREIGRLEAVRDASYTEPDDREEGESPNRESEERTFQGRREQLMREAIRRAAGAAVRHVTSAGHRQIEDNVRNDAVAIGWARTTKPGCCYFCAMLASRGYVYKEESFEDSNARFGGVGEQKVHDNCGCGLRPIYSPVDPLPDRTEALEQMWIDMSNETSFAGQKAINEFRRRYEASELARPMV